MKSDGGGDYTTIQAAVNAVPGTLGDNYCVIVDSAPYTEQVTVEGKDPAGLYRLTIMSDPSMASTATPIAPPVSSTAAFLINNASVTIQGFDIIPAASVAYGVYSSSAHVNISTVNVDGPAYIWTAGIRASSWSAISYSSVTVLDAKALWLEETIRASVSYTTMTNTSTSLPALHIVGGGTNTVTNSLVRNPSGHGAYVFLDSNFNTISFSTIVSNRNTAVALFIESSDSNTVTDCYMQNLPGHTVMIHNGADDNVVSRSTAVSNATDYYAMYIDLADRNLISSVIMRNNTGHAAYLGAGSDYNEIRNSSMVSVTPLYSALYLTDADNNKVTGSLVRNNQGPAIEVLGGSDYTRIIQSTVVGNGFGKYALSIMSGSSNGVYASYVQGSSSTRVDASVDTVISGSVLVATGTTGVVLHFTGAGSALTVATSTLRGAISGGSVGSGLLIDENSEGMISVGSVTVIGVANGLSVSTGGLTFDLRVDSVTFQGLPSGATAIHFLGGTFVSTITLAYFDDWSFPSNVSGAALDLASRITMRFPNGPRSGPAYENDPNSLVQWYDYYPGCVETRFVGAGQNFASIQAGVNALPTTLTGHSCVIVRDAATYNEQVTVQGFVNNGSSISIFTEPSIGAHAVVTPPVGSTAAFHIANSSINLVGIDALITQSVPYGVAVTSGYVNISSVSVSTLGSLGYYTAAMALGPWSTLSHSTITAWIAHGLWMYPSAGHSSVSYSTVTADIKDYFALYIQNSDSNTIADVYIRNTEGRTVYLSAGSDENVLDRTQIYSNSATDLALYLLTAATNTITRSSIVNGTGSALRLNASANFNTISQSTVVAGASSAYAYDITASSVNALIGSYVQNEWADAAQFASQATYNTIVNSTVVANNFGGFGAIALDVSDASSNGVTGSLIRNMDGTAAYFSVGANFNSISGSTIIGTGASFVGFHGIASSGLSLTNSYVANATGEGVILSAGADYATITLSTITSGGFGSSALSVQGAASATVTNSYMYNLVGYGAYFDGGAWSNAVIRSTAMSADPATNGLFLKGANETFIQDSYIYNSAGDAVSWANSSRFNRIQGSTLVTEGASARALYIGTSDSNTVTNSMLSAPSGHALYADAGSDHLVVVRSTMLANGGSGYGFAVFGSSGAMLFDSYLQASTAAFVSGSTSTRFGGSVFVTTTGVSAAIVLTAGSEGLALATSTLRSANSSFGLMVQAGNTGTLAIGSVTVMGATQGVTLDSQDAAFVLAIDSITFRGLSAASRAIRFNGGTFVSTVTLANFEDASVAVNVDGGLLAAGSRVTMRYFSGVTGGPTFENDPSSRVDWIVVDTYPGCVETRNVGAGQNFATIQGAVNALPTSLPGHSCVVIKDDATYAEEVSIRNFVNNGSSISVFSAAPGGLRPLISPPGGSNAAFTIENSSVNIHTINIDVSQSIPYGIYSSSQHVNISSISLTTSGVSAITTAGVRISSWSMISYSTIVVGDAYGVRVDSAVWSGVLFSTIVIGSGDEAALLVNTSSSGTYQGIYLYSPRWNGAHFRASRNNNITESRFYGASAGASAAFFFNGGASDNTVDRIFVSNTNGHAGGSVMGSDRNTIANSTFTSDGVGYYAFLVNASSRNTLSGARLTSSGGFGLGVIAGSYGNIVTQSTVTIASFSMAVQIDQSDANVISDSYIESSGGAAVSLRNGADGNSILASTVAALNVNPALYVLDSDSNTFALGRYSSLQADAIGLDVGSDDLKFIDTFVLTEWPGATAMAATGVSTLQVVGTRMQALAGSALTVSDSRFVDIGRSTMIAGGAASVALYMNATASSTVSGSYMYASSGWGLYLDNTSSHSVVSQSTVVSNAGAFPTAYMTDSRWITLSGLMIANPSGGGGVSIAGASDHITLAQSTVTVGGASTAVAFVGASSSNTVSGSYMESPTGTGVSMSGGSSSNTVSGSVVIVANGSTAFALSNAPANTLVDSRVSAGNTYGVSALGSHYTGIVRSTITNASAASEAMYLDASSSNTVSESYIENVIGAGGGFSTNAGFSLISQSTAVSRSGSNYALYSFRAPGNRFDRVTARNLAGGDGLLIFQSNFSTIERSSMVSEGAGAWGLRVFNSSATAIYSSYAEGGIGMLIEQSQVTRIGGSWAVATTPAAAALSWTGSGHTLYLATSTLRGASAGNGLLLDSGGDGLVSVGSVTVSGAAIGVNVQAQLAGFSLAIDSVTFRGLSPGATAISFQGVTLVSTVTLANFEDASVAVNVDGTGLAVGSRVTMREPRGVRAWAPYETDPSSRVDWISNLVPAPGMPPLTPALTSLIARWFAADVAGTPYLAQISLASDFSAVLASSQTVGVEATFSGLTINTTYFARVAVYQTGTSTWGAFGTLGSTGTLVETPTRVVFDEVVSNAVAVSAFAPTPAFTGLENGYSGTDHSIGAVYAEWRGGGGWAPRAAMSTARSNLAVASVGGKLYAIGGVVAGAASGLNEVYDPATNVWTTLASMPTARYALAAAAVGGKIYAVGGSNGAIAVTTVEEYDPATNQWATKASMPTPRQGLAAAATGDRLYAIGGSYLGNRTETEEYDPATNAWTARAAMPTGRYGLGAAVVDGLIYAVGGSNGPANERYDPALNAWVTRANLPSDVFSLGVAGTGGRVYAAGGYDDGVLATVREYDPTANAWRTLGPLPTAREGLSLGVAGGRLHAVGGSDGSALAANERYDPGVGRRFENLTPNTVYAFGVKARNVVGAETGAVSDSTRTAAALPGAAPLSFTGVGTSGFTAAWSSGTSAEGYNPAGTLYSATISTSADFSPILLSSQTRNRFASFSGLSSTTHYARVRAINDDGRATQQFVLGAVSLSVGVSAGPFTNLGPDSLTANWTSGQPGGTLYLSQLSSGALPNVFTGNQSSNTMNVFADYSGLSPDTVYHARVSTDAGGPFTGLGSVRTLAYPPSGSAAGPVWFTSATLNWGANGNLSQTQAEVETSTDNAVYSSVFVGSSAVSHVEPFLLGCTTYYFRVRYRNGDSVPTAYDATVSFRTENSTPNAASAMTAASLSGNRIALNWSLSSSQNVASYRLYGDAGGTGIVDYGSAIAVLTSTETGFTTGVLVSSPSYKFGLRATNACGVEESNTGVQAAAAALAAPTSTGAIVAYPPAGAKIKGDRVSLVSLEPADSMLFQYKASTDSAWTDVVPAGFGETNPVTRRPFALHWDVTGLTETDYDLRAVATISGSSDTAPAAITVSVTTSLTEYDSTEDSLGGGLVQKEQLVSNSVTNTVFTFGESSPQLTRLVLPAGALDDAETRVTVVNNPAMPAPPTPDLTSIGAAVEITLANAQTVLANDQTAEIAVTYRDENGDGVVDDTAVKVANLRLYSYDSTAGAWVRDFASEVDTVNRAVIGRTPHFSVFALFAAAANDLASAQVYPVPFKPNGGNPDQGRPYSPSDPFSGIIFDNLPGWTTVRIYTLTGQLVATLSSVNGPGRLQWDARIDGGREAPSGGYFAIISSRGSRDVRKKLVIIR